MNAALFDTIQQAVEHAKQHGGWIAHTDTGLVYWFAPGKWTQTPIIKFIRYDKTADIGTWPMFDETAKAELESTLVAAELGEAM